MWELIAEARPARTTVELKSGAVPSIPESAVANFQEEAGAEVTQQVLALIVSCLAPEPHDRPESRRVMKDLTKMHDAVAKRPNTKPEPIKRRRTKERGIGGHAIRNDDTSTSPPARRHDKKRTHSNKVVSSPKEGISRKKQPSSPRAIRFEVPEPGSSHTDAHSEIEVEDTRPRRVSIEQVL